MAAVRAAAPTLDKARMEALAQLDLVKILRAYIASMVDGASGYKGLVLDKETMRVCSMLFGRTELAEHNVVHVEALDSSDGRTHTELKVCVRRRLRMGGVMGTMTVNLRGGVPVCFDLWPGVLSGSGPSCWEGTRGFGHAGGRPDTGSVLDP